MQTLSTEDIALSALLTRNQQRLEYEETQMRKSINALAESLKSIRDSGCWKIRGNPYESFADYCRKKFNFSEARASQLITAGGSLKALCDAAGDNPELRGTIEQLPETVFRQLKGIPDEDAIKAIQSIKKSGNKITGPAIRKAINPDAILPPSKACCPTCGHKLSKPIPA